MNWDRAREQLRVPPLDREGASAFLWSDGKHFAVVWAPEGQLIARGPKARGSALKVQAYKKTLERWRKAGHGIVACYDAQSQPIGIDRVATLVRSRQIAWERFNIWKYYGIGGKTGDDAECKFEVMEIVPAESAQTMKLYRALKAHLGPQDWQSILHLLPEGADNKLKREARFNRFGLPLIRLSLLGLVLWGAYSVVRSLVELLS